VQEKVTYGLESALNYSHDYFHEDRHTPRYVFSRGLLEERLPVYRSFSEQLGGLPEHRVENYQQHTCNKEQRAEQRAQQFHAPQLLSFVSNGKDFELLRNQEYLISRYPLTEDKPSSGHQHENYAFTHSHPQDD